jgi:ankyrin repeat protein
MLSEQFSPLITTIKTGSLEVFIEEYKKYNHESSRQPGSINKDNAYLIRTAAENGHLDIVKFLISEGVDVHSDKDYPLRYSARYGHFDVVKLLIENGADIHSKNNRALQQACNNGHLSIVQYLMNKGANPDCEKFNSIYSAAKNKHYDIVKFFMTLEYNIEKIVRSYKEEEVIKTFSSWLLNSKLNNDLAHKESKVRLKL